MSDDLKNMLGRATEWYEPTAPDPASARRRARRRERRRRIGTGILAFVLVLGSGAVVFAAFRDARPHEVTGGHAELRTSELRPGVALTYPTDWTLVDLWPTASMLLHDDCVDTGDHAACTRERFPSGDPVLQLSNVDLGSDGDVCHKARPALPDNAAVLYVGYDVDQLRIPGSPVPTWPVELASRDDSPCSARPVPGSTPGESLWAQWLAPDGAPYLAYAYLGPDVSLSDRAQLADTFAHLSFAKAKVEPSPLDRPAYVVASGSDRGKGWNLEVTSDLRIGLDVPAGGGGGVLRPVLVQILQGIDASTTADHTMAWGALPPNVARLEASTESGEVAVGTIVPLEYLGAGYQAFAVSLPDPTGSTITTYDANGNEIGSTTLGGLDTVRVPDVVGLTFDAARDALRALGLRVEVSVTTGTYANAAVVEQDPAPGTTVVPDQIVRIVVGPADPASGPELGDVLFRGRTNDCFWTLYGKVISGGSGGGLLSLIGDDGKVLGQALIGTFADAPPLQLRSFVCEEPRPALLAFGIVSPRVADLEWHDPSVGSIQQGATCIPSEFPDGWCVVLEDFGPTVEVVAYDEAGNEIDRATFP